MNRLFNPFNQFSPHFSNKLPPPNYYNNINKNSYNDAKKCSFSSSKNSDCKKNCKDENLDFTNPIFEFKGIKIFSDDLLILALIYFLYKENSDDKLLIIALFALLFS